MIRVKAPVTEAPDTSNWTEADWDRAMLECSLKRDEESRSGFVNDPVGAYRESVCKHPNHSMSRIIVIPRGQLYRHVCPGCKHTSYWKQD